MTYVLAFIVTAFNLISIVRLFTYQSAGVSRFKISLAAGALKICLFAQIIYVLTSSDIAFYDVGFSALIMSALLASRGNVACFFNEGHGHV